MSYVRYSFFCLFRYRSWLDASDVVINAFRLFVLLYCVCMCPVVEVLRGIDWEAVTIDVMTVEMNGGEEQTSALVEFLSEKGYSMIAEGSKNQSRQNGNWYKLEFDSAFVHQRVKLKMDSNL